MKKSKQPEPDVIRFKNGLSMPPSYTLVDLTEADIWLIHQGIVPAWLSEAVAFWLRDQPKPSDVPADQGRKSA